MPIGSGLSHSEHHCASRLLATESPRGLIRERGDPELRQHPSARLGSVASASQFNLPEV
jgi:hypothetical protein